MQSWRRNRLGIESGESKISIHIDPSVKYFWQLIKPCTPTDQAHLTIHITYHSMNLISDENSHTVSYSHSFVLEYCEGVTRYLTSRILKICSLGMIVE